MKKMMIVAIALLAMLFNLDAARRGSGQGFMGQKGPDGMRMLRMIEVHGDALGLTDKQKTEIKELCSANAEQAVALQNKNNLLKVELGKLMLQEKRDYAQIKTLMNQMGENRTELHIISLKNRDKMLRLLTPEQQKILTERMGPRMGRGQRGNRGPGRGNMTGERPMRRYQK